MEHIVGPTRKFCLTIFVEQHSVITVNFLADFALELYYESLKNTKWEPEVNS